MNVLNVSERNSSNFSSNDTRFFQKKKKPLKIQRTESLFKISEDFPINK